MVMTALINRMCVVAKGSMKFIASSHNEFKQIKQPSFS
jgi:hypothetical protein